MKKVNSSMRYAMAMIELIFAIVIIAISVITIPTMMSIAGDASKRGLIDDDVMARLSAQMIDKMQARWGGEYTIGDQFDSNISVLSSQTDLNCSRTDGTFFYRLNPNSKAMCNLAQIPLPIPSTAGSGVNQADGNVSKGLEMLNAGTETLMVSASTGENISINATYNVRYVDANITPSNHTSDTVTTTWKLGSSGTITSDNGGDLGTNEADRTHLKRVVVRFWNNNLGVDSTLTFFRSNKGGN